MDLKFAIPNAPLPQPSERLKCEAIPKTIAATCCALHHAAHVSDNTAAGFLCYQKPMLASHVYPLGILVNPD